MRVLSVVSEGVRRQEETSGSEANSEAERVGEERGGGWGGRVGGGEGEEGWDGD